MEAVKSTSNNTDSNINKEKKVPQVRLKCPKGMKLPKAIKRIAALMDGTREEKRHYMKVMGIAIHESTAKARAASRDIANKARAEEKVVEPVAE